MFMGCIIRWIITLKQQIFEHFCNKYIKEQQNRIDVSINFSIVSHNKTQVYKMRISDWWDMQ